MRRPAAPRAGAGGMWRPTAPCRRAPSASEEPVHTYKYSCWRQRGPLARGRRCAYLALPSDEAARLWAASSRTTRVASTLMLLDFLALQGWRGATSGPRGKRRLWRTCRAAVLRNTWCWEATGCRSDGNTSRGSISARLLGVPSPLPAW